MWRHDVSVIVLGNVVGNRLVNILFFIHNIIYHSILICNLIYHIISYLTYNINCILLLYYIIHKF